MTASSEQEGSGLDAGVTAAPQTPPDMGSEGAQPSTAPSDPLVGASPDDDCIAPSPGTSPLRRLSNAEYRNSVRDIFSEVPDISRIAEEATAEFPAEPESLGFRNNAEFLTVQTLLAQKYMDAADDIAHSVVESVQLQCGDQELVECSWTWLEMMAGKIYRRDLTNEESGRYEELFRATADAQGVEVGREWVLYSMLQSPNFLYRVEEVNVDEQPRPLTGPELATRLSYTFWQSSPDEALLARVKQLDGTRPELVEALAREMLADARSDRLFQFFAEWLDIDRLAGFQRDPAVFPDLEGELAGWFEDETHAFVTALMRDPDGSLQELLTAPYTYVNGGLSEHYGLGDVEGEQFVRVAAPERSGILTQAFLLAQDKPYRTSIVRRGLKVRSDLLCQNIPAPPNDVPLNLDGGGQTLNQRQRLEQHRTDPNCATCHLAMDPIGVVFENFDAVGRFRTEDENGEAIIVESEVSGTLDANGAVRDVSELGAKLASSAQVRDCYVKQTFRFFFGRETEAADACSLRHMTNTFEASGHNLTELLVSLTQTDAFLYRAKDEQP